MATKTIHVTGKRFDLDQLDSILQKHVPGSYMVVWHTRKNIWECYVRWTGAEWYDLHPNLA
jgi:hypothetical protein